jgi:hypothetical protein
MLNPCKQSQQNDEKHVIITYESPKPLTENEQKRLEESTTSLHAIEGMERQFK